MNSKHAENHAEYIDLDLDLDLKECDLTKISTAKPLGSSPRAIESDHTHIPTNA